MIEHPNKRTVAALEKVMEEIQFLVDHPRMEQRNWVAKGKQWLPILQHAKEDLQREVNQQDFVNESYQGFLVSLARLGLKIEKRDEHTWGYRWFDEPLIGAYPTRATAMEAALKIRLQR
jgi:hypothetical protein